MWTGSPARRVDEVMIDRSALPPPVPVARGTERAYAATFAGCLMLFAICAVLPLLPVLVAFAHWSEGAANREFTDLVYTPAVALLYVVLVAGEIVLLRWVLLAGSSKGPMTSTAASTSGSGSSIS